MTARERLANRRQSETFGFECNALHYKPFVFPAPKPPDPVVDKPFKPPQSSKPLESPKKTAAYPCEICAETTPYYYCDACKNERNKRRKAERDRENEKQRKTYARRRQRLKARRPPVMCAGCGQKVESNRKDARFCGAPCRQKAYRKRVTAVQPTGGEKLESRNTASVTANQSTAGATLKIHNGSEAQAAMGRLLQELNALAHKDPAS